MKNILLLAHDDLGQEARLRAALDVTRALHGRLTCLEVTIAPPLIGEGSPAGDLLLRVQRNAERHNTTALRARIEAERIACEWQAVPGDAIAALIGAARLADLVVLNCLLEADEEPDMVALTQKLVDKIRAPVLAVPQNIPGLEPTGHAVVLWDGSSDAEAALCAAMPLLSLSRQVSVLYVDDGSLDAPLDEVMRYLMANGVAAHPCRRDAGGQRAAVVIEQYLRRNAPAFAVMGAFGHSRLHDAVFGSVTRHLMATAPVALLLAHA